ncbi:olfactory receptor 13 [Panthera uncia]|uniref:olfactory receptor 13 n=1 Tax=Panthera uncia TaxID=29064 RepID=UPI0020FFB18C|nr:olfactory receptor 13 [Panthera uncia]
MEANMTSITEFTLLGFPLALRIQMLLFGIFSLFYAFTLLGNGLILGLIWLDSRLHTPMYFFLSHLAIVDIAYACNTVPQMLINLLKPDQPISFAGCMTQTFLFLTFAVTECLLLVVMSYDRYVAICHPLRYPVIMSWRVCIMLVVTSWTFGVLLSLIHLILLLPLPFCRSQKINHFFCEIMAVLKLVCADTHINEIVVLAGAISVLVGPFSLIVISYMCILCAILRIQSGEGQRKAFSTCSSHLCVVGLFYGTAIIMYVGPRYGNPKEQKKYLLLFHSLFNPMLNPLIYSLRNSEVKNALKRVLGAHLGGSVPLNDLMVWELGQCWDSQNPNNVMFSRAVMTGVVSEVCSVAGCGS